MATARLKLRCGHCGSEKFIQSDKGKTDNVITCSRCGRKADQGRAARLARDAAEKLVNDLARKAGFKIK